jgi:hypothetical protein
MIGLVVAIGGDRRLSGPANPRCLFRRWLSLCMKEFELRV